MFNKKYSKKILAITLLFAMIFTTISPFVSYALGAKKNDASALITEERDEGAPADKIDGESGIPLESVADKVYGEGKFATPFNLGPIGILGEGTTYTWEGDATGVDLTGVTEIKVKTGASGTLKLVEGNVSIDVEEVEDYTEAEIIAGENVSLITLISVSASQSNFPKFKSLSKVGAGDFALVLDTTAFAFEELSIASGNLAISASGGVLGFDSIKGSIGTLETSGDIKISGSVEANINTFTVASGNVYVYDGILGNIDTLNVKGSLIISTKLTSPWGDNPDTGPANPGIQSVKNININENGYLYILCGNNNVSGTVSPNAINLANGGKIDINNGTLEASGSDGSYGGNPGGAGIYALGSGEIAVRDGNVTINGGFGTKSYDGSGSGIKASENFDVILYGATASYKSVSIKGGMAGPATYGNITAHFYIGSGEPVLELENGKEYTGSQPSLSIKGNFPGVFEIDESEFDIEGDLTDETFTVKPKKGDGTNAGGGLISFVRPLSNNLYIYAGTDENNPTANQEFTVSKSGEGEGKLATTGSNGRAMFPYSEDGEYTISFTIEGVPNSFDITVFESLFAESDLPSTLPAGISIRDGGNGLQILPNGQDITITEAIQTGGVSGKKDSEGILLTFSSDVSSLPSGILSAEGVTFGTPNDNNDSDNKTWYVPITDMTTITNEQNVNIKIANWGKYKVTNTTSAILYKRGEVISFTAVEVGGQSGITDSTGILLTFSQEIEGLTSSPLNISGENDLNILNVQMKDSNLKTWLISININSISNQASKEIDIQINDFNGYLFPAEPTKVEIYRSVKKEITYTAETIDGTSDTADTTAIRIKLSGITNGFSKDSVIFKDVEGTELTGIIKGQLKYEGLEDVQEVYTLPISGEFENGQVVTVVLNPWQYDAHYTIGSGQTEQKITLYKDTREALTFSLEQVGGISNQLRTQYVKITFNKAVKGLTISDITPSLTDYGSKLEAVNPDGDNKSTTWKLTARGFGVGNGKEFSLTIKNFGTYKLDDNNRTQKVVVYDSQYSDNSFYLEQVGGLNKLEDTESINISFRLGVNLTSDNIQVEGAQKGELTKVGTEGLLWNLKISGIDENNKKVKIKIIDPGESFWLTTTEKEITVYKDTRYYIDYKFEEIGGIDGEKNTEAFKITFTDREGNPLSKEIESLYLRNVYWSGAQLDTPQKVEGEINTWLLPVAHFNWVENGDTVTMDLQEIKVKGETVELIEPHKEAKIYLDARVKVWLYGGAYDGKKGIETTKYLFFPGDKLTFEDFKKEDFKLEGADLVRLVKPEGLFGSWYILLEIDNIVDDDNDGQAEVKLTVLNQPKGYVIESLNDEQTIRVYKDTRKHLDYEIIEVGGTKDKKTTEFVKVKFNQEVEWQDFHRVNLMNALNDKLIDMEMPIEIDTDGRTVEFPVIATGKFENGDKAYLNIIPTREGGVVVDTERQVFTLHKKVASQGKRIETVSPSIIYNGSKQKILTLIGYFGTDGAKGVKSIILRDKNNTSNTREIVLDHWGKNYHDEAQLRQKLDIDLSKIEMLNTVGEYEIAFRGKDGYFSEYAVLRISDDEMYSTDAYGILAVTQRSDKSFAVETFPSEALMNSNKTAGTTLVTLRGNISRIEDNYLIMGDSVLNKAIDYIPSGDSSILIGPKSGGIFIKADKGQLKWNGIEVSGKGFSIDLSSSKTYRNKRTASAGDNVELIGSLQEFNFDALAFSVEVGKYKLYEDEFSMNGRIAIGEALPNFMGEAGASIELEEMLLQNKGLGIPPMKASGNIGFSPSEMFGDFVGASGGLELELNTLPEEAYNYLKGGAELDISDVIYLQGEFVFAWGKRNGKMYFTPDTLKFFGRIGEGGIPLVPPVVVAYINGVGGGVSGIADIVSKNYGKIPPLELSISGAITDVSGFIASVDKATITIGPKIFSAKAEEMTLLKIVKLLDVGIAMGLTESQVDDRFLDAFFEAGGHINILNDTITGGLNVSAKLYGYHMGQAIKAYMTDVSKNGFNPPNQEVRNHLYNAFDVEGEIYAGVHAECWLGEIDGKGWLYGNKVLLSGGASGYVKPFWGTEYEGSVWVKYYFKDGKVQFSQAGGTRVASLGIVGISPMGQEHIVAQGDDGEMMVLTNIENLGTYYPTGQRLMMRGLMGSALEQSGTTIENLKKGAIVVIQAESKYPSITIYKDNIGEEDEPYHIMVTGEWADANYDFPELDGKGKYLVQYQIPEDGNYRFLADGDLICTVAGLAAMPQFDSLVLDKNNNKVTWKLNDEADKKIDNLYVRLNLVDAETGSIVSNLTVEEKGGEILTSIKASPGTFTYELPSTLESGKYYISAKLFEIQNNEEIVLDVAHTDEFDYTSNTGIDTVGGIGTEYLGNGIFKVSWDKVEDADGYIVTIVDMYRNKLAGIGEINVKAKDNKGADVTSTEILAGLFTLTDEETEEEIIQGIEFDKDYKVSVKAYKNKTYSFGDDEYTKPLYGEPGYGDLNVPEPKTPQLTVYATGANEVREEDGSSIYYANNLSPIFELAFDTKVDNLTVELKGETVDLTGETIAYNYLDDGSYLFEITATKGKDIGYYALNVVIDTKAPMLQIEGDSFKAYNKRINISGFTEAGAQVESSMGQVETSGTMFNVTGEIEGDNSALILTSRDRAGNITERALNLVDELRVSHIVTVKGSYATNSGAGSYTAGTRVNIYAGNRSGYSFAGWTSSDVTIIGAENKDASFVMPDKAVSVTANWSYNGGSGSSSSSPTPLTVSAAEGKVQVNYTVSGNTANLSLTNTKIAEIIAKSEEEAVIDLSEVKNINSVELSKEALLAFGRAGLGLTIKMPKGSLTLDVDAAASIASQATGSNLRMELKEVAQASLTAAQQQGVEDGSLIFDINIYSADKKIGSFEGSLTIEIPYGESEHVGVWYLNDAGELEKLESTFANGLVTFVLDHLSLYVIGEDKAPVYINPFTDVNTGDWFYDDVKYAYEDGLMVGTGTINFSPNLETTRGMIVTILHRMEGAPEAGDVSIFTDVTKGKWYSNAVKWATENRIVAGYGNGKFGPEDSITREQMAVILMNYAKLKGYDVSAKTNLEKFTDSSEVSDWATNALAWANAKGLINGISSEILAPQGLATRAQVAAILHRFIERFK